MAPSPEREGRVLPEAFIFRPHGPGIPDPIFMEYVLDKVEPEQRGPLIANALSTMAEVHQALAKGAAEAARIVAGEGG
jgi:hypothetical protein